MVFISGTISYCWTLEIPITDKRSLEISTFGSDYLDEIGTLFRSVVDSMEFDAEVIARLPVEEEMVKYSWKNATEGQTQHCQAVFTAQDRFVGLYTTKNKLFTPAEMDNDFEIVVELCDKIALKKNKRLLLEITTDPVEVPVDFYLNTDSPAENNPAWDQIIEGFINLSTGKLFANDSFDDDPALEIVLPQKGIYKFRVYYAGLDYKLSEVEENWQIYLWPTDETKESNEIKVIKAFK